MRSENRTLALQKTREKGLQRSRWEIGSYRRKGKTLTFFLVRQYFDKTMNIIYWRVRAKIAEI